MEPIASFVGGCSNPRFVDLLQALECVEDPDDTWCTSLILRCWDPSLRHDWEFRCFVHEGCLTAISQYNHYCVFEQVRLAAAAAGGQALRREIVRHWARVCAPPSWCQWCQQWLADPPLR